jgi:hypothetical protein
MAMTLTLGLGMAIFELFQQNERLFRDQGLRLEMQQSVRVVAYEVSDIVRVAGQGVPVHSSSFDDQPNEATVAVLAGSG